ncbi:hypothetical protein [Streptomyces gardneri]|uniref:Alanine-rich protein n=1 Tax=Streptomyces gardneri TaxID=66892 RepID=A0A4Y3RQY4_9ACTN|nr:hypothetical protein [Streptomyces gardneri]GEB59237.1 hypothetical protein SGA01_48420 [Streptomyces gardneri]GHG91039.1 hypothetical protein GCM10017674_19090 [Streptomyces gardneri]
MRTAAFLYPWDVDGDPAAPGLLAELGIAQVTLAAAYHSTRALSPRHPAHRIVTAEHAAVLYPPDPDRWAGRALRPYTAGDWAPGDSYGRAAEALAGTGLDVHSWVVLAHNSRLGAEHPETSVVNAYGDRYPWAPCIALPDVRALLVDLAAEAAVRPGAAGTELESCGWYGLAHLHAHDKTSGVPLGDREQYLMSLCFCPSCREGYGNGGADPDELAAAVRRALAPVWAGSGPALGLGDLEAPVLAWRSGTARSFQEAAVATVRAAAPPGFRVLLHADPDPYRCGADAGTDPAHVLALADGVVARPPKVASFAAHAGPGRVVAANLSVVTGMGGAPDHLARDAERARAAGATELRLYHAGLASDADLDAVRTALLKLDIP